jgi:hypothetical protein
MSGRTRATDDELNTLLQQAVRKLLETSRAMRECHHEMADPNSDPEAMAMQLNALCGQLSLAVAHFDLLAAERTRRRRKAAPIVHDNNETAAAGASQPTVH